MASHSRAAYDKKREEGWLTWPEVEEGVGHVKGNLKRAARLLIEKGVWPRDLARPLLFAFGRRDGGGSLYDPKTVAFLRDVVTLQPYAHLRGQRHSIGRKTRPHAPLRLLLATREWGYDLGVIRQDVVAVVEQFRALSGNTWSADQLSRWLFTGNGTRERGKRSTYWSEKVVALMKWLSILSNIPIDGNTWDQIKERSWDPVLQAVEEVDPSILRLWIEAMRPTVEGWCFPTKQPETEGEIVKALARSTGVKPDDVRRENVVTRIFQLLNRRLEDAYMTRPDDVKRWEQIRKNQGHRLPEQAEFGRFTWYDGRLYDLRTRTVVFEVPKARSLYYPHNIDEVLARFLRYAGVFAALGIATHDPSQAAPAAPLPHGSPMQWKCRYCKINLHIALVNTEPRIWCPHCFTESPELAWVVARKEDTKGVRETATS